jgi:hypothetical protein
MRKSRDRAHGKHPHFIDLGAEGRELEKLVGLLNDVPPARQRSRLARRIQGPTLGELAQDIGVIVDLARGRGTSVSEAAKRFERLAAEIPVRLSATVGADHKLVPTMTAWDPEPRDRRASLTERDRVVAALLLLWHALFFATSHARLKRCDCGRWFLDLTLGNRKKTCSTRCGERIKKRNQRRRDHKRGKGQ